MDQSDTPRPFERFGNLAIDVPLTGMLLDLSNRDAAWAPVRVYDRAEVRPYQPSHLYPSTVLALCDDPRILIFPVHEECEGHNVPVGLCVGLALASHGVVVSLGEISEATHGPAGWHFADIAIERANQALALQHNAMEIASWQIISNDCQPQWVAPSREFCGAINISRVHQIS
mgnify:FL=1